MGSTGTTETLLETPLADFHRERGARMVPFAGYAMPVQFEGILAEHNQVRSSAGLFDVSHMGQVTFAGASFAEAATALEALTPGNLTGLAPGRMRYTVLLNDAGGIIDDLIVTHRPTANGAGELGVVVNADRKSIDIGFFRESLPDGISVELHDDLALLALQGPAAATALARHAPAASDMGFMSSVATNFGDVACGLSRSGYTGEDGFEISVPANAAVDVAKALLAEAEVEPIGLGARDSLRLEAGLCLYGHDLDEQTSPVEADLGFVIAKRRREEGGFNGADRILRELAEGPSRKRVGLRLEGRAPAREGAEILHEGEQVGTVTSGTFGPTAGIAIAMGYVAPAAAATGTSVSLQVRGRSLDATVVDMPFVPHRYYKKPV